jgi:hypothetical protein
MYIYFYVYIEIEITQKSNQLAEDILYIARSLGFASYSHKRSKSWTKDYSKNMIVGSLWDCSSTTCDSSDILY